MEKSDGIDRTKRRLIMSSYPRSVGYSLLYKEPGEIPYYLSKLYNFRAIIDDYDVQDKQIWEDGYPQIFRSVELHTYKHHNKITYVRKIWKIFRMARQIDILYLVHISTDSLYKMLAYRIGGGKGKIYLKTDLGIYAKNGKDLLKWKNMSIPLKIFHYIFKPLPDVYTVEIKQSYERLSNSYYGDLVDKGKLFLLPNGFDPEILQECGITRRAVFEKEKIMITVGRIGSNQKNTELLLDVLSRVDLKDWVFYLIGPIEESFKKNIEDFYAENPDKKRNVVFTGLISQKELYEYYNRSRITVLTSRHESFAFVLVEAVYMKNYVVSTDVGWAKDMLDYVDAAIVPCEDDQIVHKFVSKLQEIVDYSDDKLNSLVSEKDIDEITWEWILKNNDAIKMLL